MAHFEAMTQIGGPSLSRAVCDGCGASFGEPSAALACEGLHTMNAVFNARKPAQICMDGVNVVTMYADEIDEIAKMVNDALYKNSGLRIGGVL